MQPQGLPSKQRCFLALTSFRKGTFSLWLKDHKKPGSIARTMSEYQLYFFHIGHFFCCFWIFTRRFNVTSWDSESSKLYAVLYELKLFRIQHYAVKLFFYRAWPSFLRPDFNLKNTYKLMYPILISLTICVHVSCFKISYDVGTMKPYVSTCLFQFRKQQLRIHKLSLTKKGKMYIKSQLMSRWTGGKILHPVPH